MPTTALQLFSLSLSSFCLCFALPLLSYDLCFALLLSPKKDGLTLSHRAQIMLLTTSHFPLSHCCLLMSRKTRCVGPTNLSRWSCFSLTCGLPLLSERWEIDAAVDDKVQLTATIVSLPCCNIRNICRCPTFSWWWMNVHVCLYCVLLAVIQLFLEMPQDKHICESCIWVS